MSQHVRSRVRLHAPAALEPAARPGPVPRLGVQPEKKVSPDRTCRQLANGVQLLREKKVVLEGRKNTDAVLIWTGPSEKLFFKREETE